MTLELKNRYPNNHESISGLLSYLSGLSNRDELLMTDNDVLSTIKSIYSIRHDLFQCLICELLGVSAILGVGETIAEQAGVEFCEELRFTPDITLRIGDSLIFIDPGVSVTPVLYAEKKRLKYSISVRRLAELGIDSCFKPICIHPNLINTEFYVDDYIPWPPEDSQLSDLSNWFDKCHGQVIKLRLMLKYEDSNHEDWLKTDNTDFLEDSSYKDLIKDFEINEQLSNHEYKTFDEFKHIFYQLAEDPDVFSVLADKEVDPLIYKSEFLKAMSGARHSTSSSKPSFHLPHAPWEKIGEVDYGLPEDQNNCLNILEKFSGLKEESAELSLIRLLKDSLKTAIAHSADRNMFTTNTYTGDSDMDFKLKKEHPKGVQYREFLRSKGLDLSPGRPSVSKGRVLGIASTGEAYEFKSKSGVQYSKNHPFRKYERPVDCLENSYEIFQTFYDMVCDPTEQSKKIDKFMEMDPGPDAESSNKIKLCALSEFKLYFSLISRAPAYEMLRCSSLTAKSLIHFNHMRTKCTDYTLINVGLPNVMHIVQGGSQNRGSDLGNPFFSLIITSNKNWVSTLFGNHIVWSVNGLYYVCYSWRRLQCNRLSFIADGYYSTLSTGFDTFLRNQYRSMGIERIKKTFGFRSLVTQCTTQRLAEFLMDIRYLSMSFISKYSDVAGLISEKFSPRYPNSFCYWVIQNLYKKCDELIESYNTPGGILMRHAYYVNDKRRAETTGGTISIKSIWCNEPVYSLQDLFDELFVYVHTIKEPSSTFHEFKKCLETINTYQSSYDKMSILNRNGIYEGFEDLKAWIMGSNLSPGQKIMGCWVDACYHMSKDHLVHPSLNGRIRSAMCSEPLSNIISTKACIPEYQYREEETTIKKRKADNTQAIQEYLKSIGSDFEDYVPKLRLLTGIKEGSVINPEKRSGRAKVVDCICDFKDRYPLTRTVLDLANWNIKNNSGRVVADICIKAQYGAKREFYVMNLGAKAMLRVFENCFKEIAKDMKEEMISVPGDGKLKYMSDIADESTKWTPDKKYLQIFVNGDCSKWSASETMSSFWGMIDGLDIPDCLKVYLKTVIALWTRKQINYPMELMQGTRYITKATEYLRDGISKQSSQNFLQGMFNYSSSVKAVLATKLAVRLWEDRYGQNRAISVRHLEHSDDYVLVVRCSSYYDFLDFRVFHKLMQRFAGITDSSKKTNCQHYIMEFISLMSFNGQMAYPSIKKTKEVGLNLASDGYQQDIMSACSRAGESVRLGVSIMSAYIQQRLQCLNLIKAYGIASGMRNEGPYTAEPFNTPTQLFGCPDCLPIAYINTYASVNEFRLYRYSKKARLEIYNLHKLTMKFGSNLDTYNIVEHNELYTPLYFSKTDGGSIKYIRNKLDVGYEDSKLFFENFPEYNVMKPNDPILLLNWIKSIYYNRSFAKAYTQLSRISLLLRLSYFVSQRCLSVAWTDKPLSIKEYYKEVSSQFIFEETSDISNILTNFNGTVNLFFELMDESTLDLIEERPLPATALKIPQPLKNFNLHNSISDVVQYGISKERFLRDRRNPKRPTLLDQDLSILESALKLTIKDLTGAQLVPLFSILKSQTVGSRYGIGHSTHSDKSVIVYVSSWMTHGVHPSRLSNFRPSMKVEIKNPFTGELQYARLSSQYTTLRNIVLENLTQIYFFLCVKNQYSRSDFRSALSSAYVNQPGDLEKILRSEAVAPDDLRDVGHKRMAGFFKYVLYGEIEDLERICLGNLGYKYSFISTDPFKKLREIEGIKARLGIRQSVQVTDAIYIIYQNSNYMSLKVKDYGIIVLGSVQQLTRYGYVHLISRYLWNEVTLGMLQNELDQGLILKIPCANKESILDFCDRSFYRHGSVHTNSGTNSDRGRLNIEVRSVPFGKHYNKSLNSGIEISLDDKTASACVGGVRLFRLNLNLCGPIFKLKGINANIAGVSVQDLSERGILYNYLSDSTRTQLDCTGLLGFKHKQPLLGIERLVSALADLQLRQEPITKGEQLFNLTSKVSVFKGKDVMIPDHVDTDLSQESLKFNISKMIRPIDLENPSLAAKSISLPGSHKAIIQNLNQPMSSNLSFEHKDMGGMLEGKKDVPHLRDSDGNYSDDSECGLLTESDSDWDNHEPEVSELPDEALMMLGKGAGSIAKSDCLGSSDSYDEDSDSYWNNYEPNVSEISSELLMGLGKKEVSRPTDISKTNTPSITVKDTMTKPIMNIFGGPGPKIEDVRGVIEWGQEMYTMEENLDEEPSEESEVTYTSGSEDEDPDMPFYTEYKVRTPGFYMSHIASLPGIIEYLIRGYTGLSDMVFVSSTNAQWEMIKFIIKSHKYIKENKFPESLDVALNYITAYFEEFIRTNKIPNWVLKGRVAWKTTENCRLRVHLCKRFRTKQAAEAERQKVPGSEVEHTEDGWLVLKATGEDLINYIINEDASLSDYIYCKEFKSEIQDIEEALRSWF